jgi:SAM-dependent methyltransferase
MHNPQRRLTDFSQEALADRHDRQLSVLEATGCFPPTPPRVLDLGAGSGVTTVWAARKGWQVTAVDIDAGNLAILEDHCRRVEPKLRPLVRTIVRNVSEHDTFDEGEFDIVYLKDLLEHVPDYRGTLTLALTSLRIGGLIFISTTNRMCPLQMEFKLPLYSWYPAWMKDYFVARAKTDRPDLANHTPYPALHWFTRRGLTEVLLQLGYSRTWDIYDLVRQPTDLTRRTRILYPFIRLAALPTLRGLRLIGDLLQPGLTVVAQK